MVLLHAARDAARNSPANPLSPLFPSRRAGLWCCYSERDVELYDMREKVSIPASGIMVLLLEGDLDDLDQGFMFPSRRAGLWCCYQAPGGLGLHRRRCFHPGERDYGVATRRRGHVSCHQGAVSIPASGIMVLLLKVLEAGGVVTRYVSIPASGIMVLLRNHGARRERAVIAIFGFHPGERDYGVATSDRFGTFYQTTCKFPSRRAGLWCCY